MIELARALPATEPMIAAAHRFAHREGEAAPTAALIEAWQSRRAVSSVKNDVPEPPTSGILRRIELAT